MTFSRTGHRILRAAVACGVGLFSVAAVVVPASIASAAPAPVAKSGGVTIASTGLRPGAIKHVWLIILENKSYDATFTGLNQNSYLWKTLPQQGVLLKKYYGTGHSSQDNYSRWCPARRPSEDTQEDCSVSNKPSGRTPTSCAPARCGQRQLRPDELPGERLPAQRGQRPLGENGCTYPTDVPTLFNQLNAAGKTWKGYAQDIGGAQTPGPPSSQPTPCRTVRTRRARPGTAANNPDTDPTNMSADLPPGVTSLPRRSRTTSTWPSTSRSRGFSR